MEMKPFLLFIACVAVFVATLSAQSPDADPASTLAANLVEQDSTAIAAIALGISPTSQVDLNLNAPIDVSSNANSDSLSSSAPSSVPEPTTAIFIGSGICFFVISRLRKRQEIFDYYNK